MQNLASPISHDPWEIYGWAILIVEKSFFLFWL